MGSSDTLGVDEDCCDSRCAASVRHVVKVADGIWVVVIDGRRNDMVSNRQTGDHGLDAATRSEGLTTH